MYYGTIQYFIILTSPLTFSHTKYTSTMRSAGQECFVQLWTKKIFQNIHVKWIHSMTPFWSTVACYIFQERTGDQLKKNFNKLAKTQTGTGNPNMPEDVKLPRESGDSSPVSGWMTKGPQENQRNIQHPIPATFLQLFLQIFKPRFLL